MHFLNIDINVKAEKTANKNKNKAKVKNNTNINKKLSKIRKVPYGSGGYFRSRANIRLAL